MPTKSNELVLCVESQALNSLKRSGFIQLGHDQLEYILKQSSLWFGPRNTVEQQLNLKQIIPYIVLTFNNSFAVYRRSKAGRESRLHQKLSIGFGGHICLHDIVMQNSNLNIIKTINQAAQREVLEEISVATIKSRTKIGIINDNRDMVGKVHVGVVELWTLSKPNLCPKDPSIYMSNFVHIKQLKDLQPQMERWARILSDFFLKQSLDVAR